MLTIAALGFRAHGARRWAEATQHLRSHREAGRRVNRTDGPSPPSRCDARELDGLPAPVQLCFRAVLTPVPGWQRPVGMGVAATQAFAVTAWRAIEPGP